MGSGPCAVFRAVVLEAAGIDQPRALAVAYKNRGQLVHTVHSLREHYPKVRLPVLLAFFSENSSKVVQGQSH